MKEYRFVIVGNDEELRIIEKAIDRHLSRYYHATIKRTKSNSSSVTFSVNLHLMWGETFTKILNCALYRGLKDTGIMNDESWLVDTL